jgi:hypothetical protein
MGEAGRRKQVVVAEMTTLIGAKSCRSCEHRLKAPGQQNGLIMCRRYPPTPLAVQVVTEHGPQWAVNAFYPQVNPDWPCGEYSRSALNAAEELAEHTGMTTQ